PAVPGDWAPEPGCMQIACAPLVGEGAVVRRPRLRAPAHHPDVLPLEPLDWYRRYKGGRLKEPAATRPPGRHPSRPASRPLIRLMSTGADRSPLTGTRRPTPVPTPWWRSARAAVERVLSDGQRPISFSAMRRGRAAQVLTCAAHSSCS